MAQIQMPGPMICWSILLMNMTPARWQRVLEIPGLCRDHRLKRYVSIFCHRKLSDGIKLQRTLRTCLVTQSAESKSNCFDGVILCCFFDVKIYLYLWFIRFQHIGRLGPIASRPRARGRAVHSGNRISVSQDSSRLSIANSTLRVRFGTFENSQEFSLSSAPPLQGKPQSCRLIRFMQNEHQISHGPTKKFWYQTLSGTNPVFGGQLVLFRCVRIGKNSKYKHLVLPVKTWKIFKLCLHWVYF